jgi:hypothetical protein
VWAKLSEFPSFRNRLATQEDINAGRAAFLVPGQRGPAGKPMDLEVPQYAYHVGKEKRIKIPGILIQAVEVNGVKIVAFASLPDRKFHIATIDEFQLLGVQSPS